jgi:hypothetical protein
VVTARKNRERLDSLKVELIDRLQKSGLYEEKDEEALRRNLSNKQFVDNCFSYVNNRKRNGDLQQATRTEYNGLSFVALVQEYCTVLKELKPATAKEADETVDKVTTAHKLLRQQNESLFHEDPRIAPKFEDLIKSAKYIQTLPKALDVLRGQKVSGVESSEKMGRGQIEAKSGRRIRGIGAIQGCQAEQGVAAT